MTCSICIATFKRPGLLNKLLNSLFVQVLPEEVDLEIIVVDNDTNETAKSTCNSFSQTDNIKLCYLTQPVQNISLTRNKAVERSTGEYIFFVDDDTYTSNTWIAELLKCITKYNADAVFGAVIPYYETGIPEWIKKGGYFTKPVQITGSKPTLLYTTNCIIKSVLLKDMDEPFDPECGLTGGEDGLLFGSLERNGSNFVFSAEAVVYDFVPIDRGHLKYLSQRAFRRGITYSRHGIKLSKNKILLWFFLFTKGIAIIFISFGFFILFSPFIMRRNYWWIKMSSNLGHIAGLLNVKYEMYKK